MYRHVQIDVSTKKPKFPAIFYNCTVCACSDLSLYRKRILPYGRYVLLHKNINLIKLYINYIKNNARTLIKLLSDHPYSMCGNYRA